MKACAASICPSARRETIRSQLSIPVSIISFSIFGYVAFAQYFDVSDWRRPVTFVMTLLMLASLGLLFTAVAYLACIEIHFMAANLTHLEAERHADNEDAFFWYAYYGTLRANETAAHYRGIAFILLLGALLCFVTAVALLPLHLLGTGVHGR